MADKLFEHEGQQVYGSDFGSVVKDINPSDRTITLFASDESVDRDGDVISVKGWQLDNYLKNPALLWSHNYYSVPLARCMKIVSTKNPLVWTHKFKPLQANRNSGTKDFIVLFINIPMQWECLPSLIIV
jgi:hypothetical protein